MTGRCRFYLKHRLGLIERFSELVEIFADLISVTVTKGLRFYLICSGNDDLLRREDVRALRTVLDVEVEGRSS